MEKIVKIYDKIAEWLCSFGSDKWLHFIIGLLISYLMARLAEVLGLCIRFENCHARYAMIGILVAGIAGAIKEIIDITRRKEGDEMDVRFTAIGGITGSILYLI